MSSLHKVTPRPPSTFEKFLFGGMACMTAGVVTNPTDVVKVRLQIQHASGDSATRKYNGLISGLARIIREEGIRGLFKGVAPSIAREGSYSTLRIGLYEPFKTILVNYSSRKKRTSNIKADSGEERLVHKIGAGALSGTVGSAIANPTDLIKVRMQADIHGSRYSGLLHAFRSIYREEGGLSGLYKGIGPNVQRACILTATQLPTYDQSKRYIIGKGWMEEGLGLHVLCSMFAGFLCACTTSPFDCIKSRFMNASPTEYSSSLNCLVRTVSNEGVFALYKGWLPNWLRIGPHTVVSFVVLEKLRWAAGVEPF